MHVRNRRAHARKKTDIRLTRSINQRDKLHRAALRCKGIAPRGKQANNTDTPANHLPQIGSIGQRSRQTRSEAWQPWPKQVKQ
jgi:hypothetical protein